MSLQAFKLLQAARGHVRRQPAECIARHDEHTRAPQPLRALELLQAHSGGTLQATEASRPEEEWTSAAAANDAASAAAAEGESRAKSSRTNTPSAWGRGRSRVCSTQLATSGVRSSTRRGAICKASSRHLSAATM